MRVLIWAGLLFLAAGSITACSQTIPYAPATQPGSQHPATAETPPTIESPAIETSASEAGWASVKSFSGKEDITTPAFHISGDKWRIIWKVDTLHPQYTVFEILIYRQDGSNVLTGRISYSQDVPANTVNVDEGGHDYYLKVLSANLDKWTIDIEDSANLSSSQPVQITNIHSKGMNYPETISTGHSIVEWDEYVEIKNFSDSPQNIAGWQLKNITAGQPTFIFPTFKPCSCTFLDSFSKCLEECYPARPCTIDPRKSIRVYTGEPQWESGGYCFYYGPGNIWNNQTPDTAVLYNAEGQEVSSRSYVITGKNSATR